jgi:hypothetical protein
VRQVKNGQLSPQKNKLFAGRGFRLDHIGTRIVTCGVAVLISVIEFRPDLVTAASSSLPAAGIRKAKLCGSGRPARAFYAGTNRNGEPPIVQALRPKLDGEAAPCPLLGRTKRGNEIGCGGSARKPGAPVLSRAQPSTFAAAQCRIAPQSAPLWPLRGRVAKAD